MTEAGAGRLRQAAAAGLAAVSSCLVALAAADSGAAPARPAANVTVVDATAADVLAEVRSARGSVVVVNVWATWCVPCREEFPDLLKLQREFRSRGMRLILVSADLASQRAQVERFLGDQGVGGRTFAKAQADQEFIDGLERRWSGALPATLLFDRRGRQVAFWEGSLRFAELRSEVESLIGER